MADQIVTSRPFPNGPPFYHFLCRHKMFVEQVAAFLGKKIQRCIDHKMPLRYAITCGDKGVADGMCMLLEFRGLAPLQMERKAWRQKGLKHRVDPEGNGPIVYGTIPVDYLPIALQTLGPKYKPGTVAATAQVVRTEAEVVPNLAKRVENERPQ